MTFNAYLDHEVSKKNTDIMKNCGFYFLFVYLGFVVVIVVAAVLLAKTICIS